MSLSLQNVSLDQLYFDPQNPRLPERLKGAADDEVLKYFLLECNLVELMMSIGEKDYFAGEPLMVVPRESPADGFIVVEGNRRLGALKLLQSDTPVPVLTSQVQQVRDSAKFKPIQIPVLEFKKRDEILVYLGYRHITGIKEWDSLAKARYLKQLRALHDPDDHEKAHKALAKEIGSKSSTVAKLLTGYTLLERAADLGILHRLKLEADDIPFSLLTTGIGWEDISSFIGLKNVADVEATNLKPTEFEEFFRWVFDKGTRSHTTLGESRNFSKLARVVSNPTALTALRRGDSLDIADLMTSGPLDAIRSHLFNAEKSLQTAQETLSLADGLEASDVAHAERIRKAAISLHSAIRSLAESSESGDAEA